MDDWEHAEPALTPPPDGTVVCWRVLTGTIGERLEPRLTRILSDGERARAGRFVQAADRLRFVAAHAALRILLGAALGVEPAALAIVSRTGGKPYLADTAVEFNLSHSGDVVLVALSGGVPVGVDVERVRPIRDRTGVVEHFFHPGERSDLSRVSAADADAAFYACWTRKEAVTKAVGLGLALPLDQFRVSCSIGEPSAVLDGCDALGDPAAWSVFHLEPARDHVGALALPRRPASLGYRTLDLNARTSL